MCAVCAFSSVPLHPPPALASLHHPIDIASPPSRSRQLSRTTVHLLYLGLMRRHALLLAVVFLLLAATSDGIRLSPDDATAPVQRTRGQEAGGGKNGAAEKTIKGFLQEEVYATGSSLPDCSHACGPCKPCSRVMVSFKCSIAEPCPMVYRCMCKGKCYPVPSS